MTQRTQRKRVVQIPEELNLLSERVTGAAIEVHRALGPGMLERLYEDAFCHELALCGIPFQRQFAISLSYKGLELSGQRLDLLIDNVLVVELKATESVANNHLAQLVSYLRAGDYPLGLLLNFNVRVLRDGIHRRIYSQSTKLNPTSASSLPPSAPLRSS